MTEKQMIERIKELEKELENYLDALKHISSLTDKNTVFYCIDVAHEALRKWELDPWLKQLKSSPESKE